MNKNKKTIALSSLTILCILTSFSFVQHNDSFYKQSIVEVIQSMLKDKKKFDDLKNTNDTLFYQELIGSVKNGTEKGESILLENTYSSSRAYDHKYQVGDDLFVRIQSNKGNNLTGTIDYPKRDKYVLVAAWLFILTVFLIGKKKGLFSLISLAINVIILLFASGRYTEVKGTNLLLICSGLVVFFTITSLLLISGSNEKTYAAILATLVGTFSALLIGFIAMKLTAEKGLRYEEIAFVTRTPQKIFLVSILVGSLGAVMDIAITITSSFYELFNKNNQIPLKDLKESGLEIGKDIMGSMTNVLFFCVC